MDVLVVFGTVTSSCFLVGFLMRDQLWDSLVTAVATKARAVVKHELHQDHVLKQATTGLNNAVERHVLNNPAVVRKTAELFSLLFSQAKMQKLASDLMGKALEQPSVKAVMSKYVTICLEKRLDEMLGRERLSKVLVSLREGKP